ncbi:MAG TPA: M56 family metallopeptidase [Vicinamibacterales bacterium]
MTLSLFAFVSWLVQTTAKGSVAIAVIAAAYALIGRRVRARWWHALWLLILLRLVVPVGPASAWSIFNLIPPHQGIEWQLRGPSAQLLFPIEIPWWVAAWKWIALVWLCGFVVVAARAVVATMRARSAVQRAAARGKVTADARRIVEEGCRRLGIRRQVMVVESPLVEAPALHGVFRPTLLLPDGMRDTFGEDELRHVVLHELAHLRRHDVAVNWLLNALQAVHWFNPLVWWAVERIAEERELACDELALSCLQTNERLGYGRTILKLLERFQSARPVPALVGMINQKRQMKRRLTVICGNPAPSRLMLPLLAALSATAVLALTDVPMRGEPRGRLDPAAVRTLERLDRRIDVCLTNASLDELAAAITAKSGVPVTRSPSIASSAATHARFTLNASGATARAVLTDALLPYGIVAEPRADSVRLAPAPPCLARPHLKPTS